MSETVTISPFLRYADAPKAVDWLQEAFGFTKDAVFANDDGTIGHAQLRLNGAVIMLSTYNADALGMRLARDTGGPTMGVYIVVDDADAHCERARAAGARILHEPQDEDYGGRDYSCLDFEGNVWSFGTYRPGAEG